MDTYSSEDWLRRMKVHYDPDVDILYIVIQEGPAYDSKEIDDDIILELSDDDKVLGIQIMHASRVLMPEIAEKIAKEIQQKVSAI